MTTLRLAVAALALAATSLHAQVGSGAGMLDPNLATETQLAALPGLNAELAKAIVAKRPYSSILQLDSVVAPALDAAKRAALYERLFVHINLNASRREEILLIPRGTNRHVREFQEYAPYTALAVFHREMRKYWDEAEVSRLEAYVFVPVDLNTATDAEINTIPGMTPRMLREFKEYRPYDSVERYKREMAKYVDAKEVERLARYVEMRKK
jgi:DNA uptake protein ComE-like DNA-binding protein